ncbi:FAD-dependent monooxygenase [Streptomyces sp. FH025]|nr:FAD-dependent monooxygenase [Streptomyces sp. FH025]
MAERTPVLIVGAGPVGLAMALALWRQGVPARILEAAEEPQHGSRAVQLHAPTLQIFERLGILDEAERRGLRVHHNSYHLSGGRTLRVELGSRNEPLMLPQQVTCELLEAALERAGARVERSTRVTEVSQDERLVTVKAEGPDGTVLIEADWLVVADGVRSSIRDQLGIDFVGEQVPVNFLLAEGRIDGPFEPGAVHYFLGKNGGVVFASMPGGRIRVSAGVPEGYPFTPEGVQRLLDERGPRGLSVAGLDMINSFGSQERVAERLRVGRAFLVGDAAHTHSPLGGQGLNLGLQDVHNLSWKLGGVINGTLSPAVLDSYQPERLQAAREIVRNTHRFLKVFTLGPAAARVRNTAWSALEATGLLRRWFVPLLAGWRVAYPDVLGGAAAAPGRRTLPAGRTLPPAGHRAPAWLPQAPAAGGAPFRLVTLGTADGGPEQAGQALAERHPGMLAHDHLIGRRTGFLLLRPDGYVAAGGTTPAELARVPRLLARLAPCRTARTTSWRSSGLRRRSRTGGEPCRPAPRRSRNRWRPQRRRPGRTAR